MRRFFPAFLFFQMALAVGAADLTLTTATVRQRENVVRLRRGASEQDAEQNDLVHGNDLLHTGSAGSLVELGFNDNKTVARLGSASAFTFSPTGSMNIATGLALVTVNGGSVVCETCTLVVVARSTVIVEAFSKEGEQGAPGRPRRCGTKVILLEGSATVSIPNGGKSKTLRAGQMIVQFEDEPELAKVQEVDLKRLISESRIVTGFRNPLPSMGKIEQVVERQQHQLWRGALERTALTIGGRGAQRYHESSTRNEIEAPFDPDVLGGIKADAPPCPVCL